MNKLFTLEGKTAIITGLSGNLGPIWAETLEKAGAITWGMDLPNIDITNYRQIKVPVAFMYPDIIINNAGIDNPPGSVASFFGNCPEIIDVNLQGAINICKAFIPGMIEKNGGTIINIGSIQGNVGADWRNYPEGFEKPVGYNVSKAGLVQLSRSIAVQYGRYNIRSVTISFAAADVGVYDPDFKKKFLHNVPLGRMVSKESLRQTLLYACCCPELTGQQIIIDGGYCAW